MTDDDRFDGWSSDYAPENHDDEYGPHPHRTTGDDEVVYAEEEEEEDE